MEKYRFIDPLTNKDAVKFRKGNRVHHKNTPNLIGTVRKGNYKGYGSLDVQLDSLKTICYDVKDVVKVSKSNKTIDKNIKCYPYCSND